MERQYESFLKALLAPLGVYDLSDGTVNEAELYGFAAGLDAAAEQVEYAEQEGLTATAEDEGLRRREALFARRPAAVTAQQRRDAIAALLQIDGDSFSLADINKTISGCGIRAQAVELGQGHIRVLFPETAGVPDEFDQIRKIVLDILPCHLETEFYFRYLTWAECEDYGWTWAAVESADHTWDSFELAV